MSRPRPHRLPTLLLFAVLGALLGGCGAGDEFIVLAASEPAPEEPMLTCPLDPTLTPTADDLDGDGLSNEEEESGYWIVVDAAGLGPEAGVLEQRHVTSDPTCADTDGDGLQDGVEAFYKTDPRARDTDGDGLSDDDEVRRWKTSPTSVDTDGDATGPDGLLAPNPLLFDGAEVETLRTSPSLADTDGDARTDYEEVDDPLRSPLIAELPKLEAVFTGEVDIRLFIEYADTVGQETEYANTFTTSRSNTSTAGGSTSVAETTAASAGGAGFFEDVQAGAAEGGAKGAATVLAGPVIEAGRQGACDLVAGKDVNVGPIRFGLDDLGPLGSAVGAISGESTKWLGASSPTETLCAPAEPETTQTTTQSFSESSTTSSQETYSEVLRASRERTETASRGTVKVGAKFRNSGLSTFSLDDIFVTMLQWQPSPDPERILTAARNGVVGAGTFRTLATLRRAPAPPGTPPLDALTLSPGEISPVVELAAVDVNPAVIKGFLARPNSIVYEPFGAALQNVDGVDFKFLTEQTYGRTASITIDYGDGRIDQYQVATNVGRDENGALTGLSLGEALEILGVAFETETKSRQIEPAPAPLTDVRVLTSIDGLTNEYDLMGPDRETGEPGSPTRLWVIYPSRAAQAAADVHFDEMNVQHGDVVRLVYTQDLDGDGLFSSEEALLGTSESLEDLVNNATGLAPGDGKPDGWDTDKDGLTDFFEAKIGWVVTINTPDPSDTNPSYRVFSDPTRKDGDRDGLSDYAEAIGAFSDPNNADTDGDGLSDLEPSRLTPAGRRYVRLAAPTGGDGLSWDTAYNDIEDAFFEVRQLNSDATPENDVSAVWLAAGEYTASLGNELLLPNGATVYGGFGGTESRLGERNPDPVTNNTILRKKPFVNASVLTTGTGADTSVLDGVSVVGGGVSDRGWTFGAGARINGSPTFRRVYFTNNYSSDPGGTGGGAYVSGSATSNPRFEACQFDGNGAASGGAVYIYGGSATFVDCVFRYNEAGFDRGPFRPYTAGGAGVCWEGTEPGTLSFTGCSFVGNVCKYGVDTDAGLVVDATTVRRRHGGAVLVNAEFLPASTAVTVQIDRCRFDRNRSDGGDGGAVAFFGSRQTVALLNSRFYQNAAGNQLAVATYNSFLPPPSFGYYLVMMNCTLVGNTQVETLPRQDTIYTADFRGSGAFVWNTVFYANEARYLCPPGLAPGDPGCTAIADAYDVYRALEVRYSCLGSPGSQYLDPSNLVTDPLFVDLIGGDLHPQCDDSGISPLIDGGNVFFDADPATQGLQLLGPQDLDGNPRRAAGPGGNAPILDIGAYEAQK